MVIAVNTRFLLPDYLEGYGNFIYETFRRITRQHPGHTFIFIFDRPFDPRFIPGPNVIPVVTGPPARHPLLWKIWYDIKVPAVLKKYKADVFVSADGFCSLTTSVPQCLVIHDLAFLMFPQGIKKADLLFYKRYTPRFLEKAKIVVTVSEFSRQDMLRRYNTAAGKIVVVPNGVKTVFTPLNEEEKRKVKAAYTGGKEYFLYTGAIHPRKNLVNLLKAFSVLKKRQGTGMKLVLAGRLAWKYGSFMEDLKSYKYRNDVVMTGYLGEEELVKVTGAAYAMVYPSVFEGFGLPVPEAMRCGVPVITSAGTAMQEIAGDAALYADPADHKSIAEQMMRLYKDENLRKQLAEKGIQRAELFSWDQAAEQLWACIQRASG